MEKRFRVLVAFYGIVVLIMMASKKSDSGKVADQRPQEATIDVWDKTSK